MKVSSPMRVGSAVLIVAIGSLLVLAVLFGCFVVMTPVLMGLGMSSGEVVRHEVVSPDGAITALVIGDDCGATCGCTVRVDLQTKDEYIKEVYRSFHACDAEVAWLSATSLQVRDDAGGEALVNVLDWGLSPP